LTREADKPETALRALEESVELVRVGASDVNFGGALARMARLRDRDGDLAGALDALHEAVTYFQRVGPRTELVVVVAQFARTLAGRGKAEPAAVVAGIVAAGPLMAMGATGTPQRMERATVTARAEIGDVAYETAFARGAAMTYDDAITYIRSQLDLAIAETDNSPLSEHARASNSAPNAN
jgi:hypothetical protein